MGVIEKINPTETIKAYFTDPVNQIAWRLDAPYYESSMFFKPTNDQFVDYMAEKYRDKAIIDCGCGQGHITMMLRALGMHVIPIDLHCCTFPDTLNMDCAMFPFTDDQVALICRPSRGAWIHATIVRAMDGCGTVVYVGKQKHYREDLAPLPYQVLKVRTRVGHDGEHVWSITR